MPHSNQRIQRVVGWLVLIGVGMGLSGCPRTDRVKFGKLTSKQVLNLLPKIRQKHRKVKGLEGRAKLRIYRNGKRRQTIRLSFQVERPNRLHLQIQAAFGQPAAVITCDGKLFAIHNLLKNQFIQGPAPRLMEFLGEFLPVPIPLEDLVSVLLGEFPILSRQSPSIRHGATQGVAILQLEEKTFEQRLWLDVPQKRFLKTTLKRGNTAPLTLEYNKFHGAPALPQWIQFTIPKRSLKIRWISSTQEVKASIPAEHFRQTPPKGIPVHSMAPAVTSPALQTTPPKPNKK